MPTTNTNLPFNPEGNIFRWGPVPGQFFYLSLFIKINYDDFRAAYGMGWSEALFLFREGRMLWLNDADDIVISGQKVFLSYCAHADKRENIYNEWKNTTFQLENYFTKIQSINLQNLSDEELKTLWEEFHQVYTRFWVLGTVPELGNYGSVSYLEDKLKAFLPVESDISSLLEVLTAPEALSFYQEEEIDLLQNSNLNDHISNYFWLKNSYAGTEVLGEDFFAERKQKLESGLEEKCALHIEETKRKKQEVTEHYQLSEEIIQIASAISRCVAWQDERKKYIFIVLHYQDVMLREVARRFGCVFADLHLLWFSEISGLIAGEEFGSVIAKRKQGFGFQFFDSCQELSTEKTLHFWKIYGEEKIAHDVNEITGIVASKGKTGTVQGRVKILLDPKDSNLLEEGEILVAPMTSPEYIFAMKKASGIITDTGGLMSHAAIVSRELNIPCIVGTKIATSVLKDGDIVEVNATKGVIIKITQS